VSARLTFRLAAAGFALLAILVAALQARRPASPMPTPRPAVQAPAPVDTRLQHCQALGAAGAQDPECLQAWEAARTRFLGRARADH